MARMTGGEALAKQLAIEGVKVIFGVPGVQLYGALVHFYGLSEFALHQ